MAILDQIKTYDTQLTAEEISEAFYNALEMPEKLAEKVDNVEGMGLSANSFTNAEKQKLSELENYDDSDLLATIANLEARIAALESNGGESEDET